MHHESHKTMKVIKEVIVQASIDTGACYREAQDSEIIFDRENMVKGEPSS